MSITVKETIEFCLKLNQQLDRLIIEDIFQDRIKSHESMLAEVDKYFLFLNDKVQNMNIKQNTLILYIDFKKRM